MRRRGMALLAATALCAGLVAGCGSSSTEADDSASEEPTVAPSVSIDPADLKPGNQPATPEAIAAITLQRVPVEPETFEGGDLYFERDEVGTVLLWGADHSLEVKAGPVDDDLLSTWCRDGMSGCVEVKAATGTATVAWDLATDDGTPGQLMVSYASGGEERRAAYVGEKITGDPRKLDLEVSVDDLVALVTDPRLGTKTTTKLTKAQVSGFPTAGANGTDEVALTAGAIAAGLLETKAYADIDSFEKADVSAYGKGAFGVVGTTPGGGTVTAVHAPNLPAEKRKCPSTLTCSKGDTDGYDGWTDGLAETVRCHPAEGDARAFCAVVRQQAPAPFPGDDLDPVLAGLETALETLWPTVAAETAARGESLVG
ncbi:hypothetical protein [Nocardioides sp. YR527]|uniref:hypothetical protein n=1 Tax=Nocardioides sp. YR527 TaxID=1881028 RepID=UPI00115FB2B2|nr:hypothetical protein [Nocardioides sp. YR527]